MTATSTVEGTHVVVDDGIGSGNPLVLVHGVGLDHTMWDPVVELLAASPRGPGSIIRYDLWGHGLSQNPNGERTFDDFVNQYLETIDEGCDAVGLSLGGAVVRGAAARSSEWMERVVISNAVFQRSEEQRRGNQERLDLARDKGMGPVADLALDRWFTSDWRAAHPDREAAVRERLATTNLDGYLKAYQVFVDGDPVMPEGLAHLHNPTLVVTGDRDTGSTPAMAQAMVEALPDARCVVMSGTGHLVPIEHPDNYAHLLLDFLERT